MNENSWLYMGDIDVRDGGLWIKPLGKYAEVVSVRLLIDDVFIITKGRVYFDDDCFGSALRCLNVDLEYYTIDLQPYLIAEALFMYGSMSEEERLTVRLYTGDEFYWVGDGVYVDKEATIRLHEEFNDNLGLFVEDMYNLKGE